MFALTLKGGRRPFAWPAIFKLCLLVVLFAALARLLPGAPSATQALAGLQVTLVEGRTTAIGYLATVEVRNTRSIPVALDLAQLATGYQLASLTGGLCNVPSSLGLGGGVQSRTIAPGARVALPVVFPSVDCAEPLAAHAAVIVSGTIGLPVSDAASPLRFRLGGTLGSAS